MSGEKINCARCGKALNALNLTAEKCLGVAATHVPIERQKLIENLEAVLSPAAREYLHRNGGIAL